MTEPHSDISTLLLTPVGAAGSGAARYAAAMALYHHGQIEADMLEIYRRCCRLDDEDPIDLARFEGLDPARSAALRP